MKYLLFLTLLVSTGIQAQTKLQQLKDFSKEAVFWFYLDDSSGNGFTCRIDSRISEFTVKSQNGRVKCEIMCFDFTNMIAIRKELADAHINFDADDSGNFRGDRQRESAPPSWYTNWQGFFIPKKSLRKLMGL